MAFYSSIQFSLEVCKNVICLRLCCQMVSHLVLELHLHGEKMHYRPSSSKLNYRIIKNEKEKKKNLVKANISCQLFIGKPKFKSISISSIFSKKKNIYISISSIYSH